MLEQNTSAGSSLQAAAFGVVQVGRFCSPCSAAPGQAAWAESRARLCPGSPLGRDGHIPAYSKATFWRAQTGFMAAGKFSGSDSE